MGGGGCRLLTITLRTAAAFFVLASPAQAHPHPPPPFWGLHRHAAFVKPATDAQAEWQATRGAHLCSGNGSAYPTATAAARAAAATDDPEDETTKPPYAQRQQLQYRAYALRKWNTVEYGPELFGERS